MPGGLTSYADLLGVAGPFPAHKVGTLGAYPGYTGDAAVELRNLYFAYLPDGTTSVSYNLDVGAGEASTSGGLHVHAGTSCDAAADVGPHHYQDDWRADPWGTTWGSDAAGVASGSFVLETGYNNASENLGHAVVVHASDGTRLACGVLEGVAGGMSNADMISATSSETFVERGVATTVGADTASGDADGATSRSPTASRYPPFAFDSLCTVAGRRLTDRRCCPCHVCRPSLQRRRRGGPDGAVGGHCRRRCLRHRRSRLVRCTKPPSLAQPSQAQPSPA